jgi:hypothetical protein
MSSGFTANHADVIPTAKVTELCPEEVEAFVAAAAAAYPERGISGIEAALKLLATELACGDDGVQGGETVAAWKALASQFHRLTGLELGVDYHDPEDGGPYDEVEGAFLFVEGMYEVSPAGRPFVGVVERRSWVTFG